MNPTSTRRIRVAIVSASLVQAGAERYVFEYARGLDKAKFEVEILTAETVTPDEFYCKKLLELGIKVHRLLPHGRDHLIDLIPTKRRLLWLKDALRRADRAALSVTLRRLRSFFRGYDVISVAGIENYYLVRDALPPEDRVIIHLMSHRFQYDKDPYALLRPGAPYRFSVFDPAQADELAGTVAEGAEARVIPLALDLSGRENLYAPRPGALKKIAIVSRINPTRRLDPLLYSFQALARRKDASLYLYGGGDPEVIRSTLDVLRIRDKVIFSGHQEDLEGALRRDQPDLVWMMSVGEVMGYGGIEVASFGVPLAFFNFSAEPDLAILERTGGAVHTSSTVPDLVSRSAALLDDPRERRALGVRLRDHIFANHDISKNKGRLEDYYLDLVGRAR